MSGVRRLGRLWFVIIFGFGVLSLLVLILCLLHSALCVFFVVVGAGCAGVAAVGWCESDLWGGLFVVVCGGVCGFVGWDCVVVWGVWWALVCWVLGCGFG
jgi:hypothetical protein